MLLLGLGCLSFADTPPQSKAPDQVALNKYSINSDIITLSADQHQTVTVLQIQENQPEKARKTFSESPGEQLIEVQDDLLARKGGKEGSPAGCKLPTWRAVRIMSGKDAGSPNKLADDDGERLTERGYKNPDEPVTARRDTGF